MREKLIHLDAVGGIAGDMFAAALVCAFPELEASVLADLALVLPPGLSASFERISVDGIAALSFAITGRSEPTYRVTGSYRDMRDLIGASTITAARAKHALSILGHLAHVEADIHGLDIEDVHFHEIADWDSLGDVVAAGSIIGQLDAQWSVSALPIGGGTIKTAHGLLPVPAPATIALLPGFEWRSDGVQGERVTPTGAAILKHLIRDTTLEAGGRLVASGAGAGSRRLPGIPNILRAMAFDRIGQSMGDVAVVSADLDDMTGEEIGIAVDALREINGVLDVTIENLYGKKGRPVLGLRLLTRTDVLADVRAACFLHTSSLGVRWRIEQREVLPRSEKNVFVDSLSVGVKTAERPGGLTRKAASDDLRSMPDLRQRRWLKTKAEGRDTP